MISVITKESSEKVLFNKRNKILIDSFIRTNHPRGLLRAEILVYFFLFSVTWTYSDSVQPHQSVTSSSQLAGLPRSPTPQLRRGNQTQRDTDTRICTVGGGGHSALPAPVAWWCRPTVYSDLQRFWISDLEWTARRRCFGADTFKFPAPT